MKKNHPCKSPWILAKEITVSLSLLGFHVKNSQTLSEINIESGNMLDILGVLPENWSTKQKYKINNAIQRQLEDSLPNE